MNKGPICPNKVFEFYSQYIPFNNPEIFTNNFRQRFIDINIIPMNNHYLSNAYVPDENVSLEKLSKKDSITSVYLERLPKIPYICEYCKYVFIEDCDNLKMVHEMFPNATEIYINYLTNAKSPSKIRFSKVERFTCMNGNIVDFIRSVSFASNTLYEFNFYYSNATLQIVAPTWFLYVRVVRIPPNLILPAKFSHVETTNRVLHYIYKTYPTPDEIKRTVVPNIDPSKYKSILYPVLPVQDAVIFDGTYQLGVYLFDPKLIELIKSYDWATPLFIHDINPKHMSVLTKYRGKRTIHTNHNFFHDGGPSLIAWEEIFPHVDILRIQKIVNRDSISNSFRMVIDFSNKKFTMETSVVEQNYLASYLMRISNRFDPDTKIEIVTRGFKFDENSMTRIRDIVGQDIEFRNEKIDLLSY